MEIKSLMRRAIPKRLPFLGAFVLCFLGASLLSRADNPKPTRIVSKSGSYIKVQTVVKQQWYIKASASVQRQSNSGPPDPATVVTLGGKWATSAAAVAAFEASISAQGGEFHIISPVSVEIGPEEVLSDVTVEQNSASDTTAPVKSVAGAQQQIAADAQTGWAFVEWLPKPPPECEVPSNPTTPAPTVDATNPNKRTYVTTTNYTWTATWKEVKP